MKVANVAANRGSGRLVRRLTISMTGLVALGSFLLGCTGIYFEWRSVNDGFDQKLTAIVAMAAQHIDGDALATIKAPADADRPEYKAIREPLNRTIREQDLTYAYTVLRNGDGLAVMLVDGSDEADDVGKVLEENDQVALAKAYETQKPAVGAIHNEDEYGRLKTAYAPIFNSKHELVGAAAVDLSAERVYSEVMRDALIFSGVWLVLTLAGVFLARRIARSVAARVTPLSTAAQELAEGDLTAGFAGAGAARVRKPDELDDLRSGLESMHQNLLHLVDGLSRSSGAVVTAASELTQAVDQVSRLAGEADAAMGQVAGGTADQARNAAEVASFFTQFSRSLTAFADASSAQGRRVAETAEQAVNVAQVTEDAARVAGGAAAAAGETTLAARAGGEAVTETAAAVREIGGAVAEAAAGLERLSSRAADIGRISDTIRSLAGESNMLALNASIEAARAGEHGRGFAVVAEAVRQLAAQSGESAAQISTILNAVRTEIEATVARMQAGLAALDAGSERAAGAQRALEAIAESAEKTREQIERVAADSARNAAVVRKIAEQSRQVAGELLSANDTREAMAADSGRAQTAVQSVAAISEETAALASTTQELMSRVTETAGRVAAAVVELGSVAGDLSSAVERFKV